tara:strand:+ start:132 stop:293 length:162 start_codon:yes stop_codon:yes gene_type:complete
MNKILLKILEPIVLVGVIIGFGFIFLIETLDLFVVRPIYQKLFKKKRRRRKRG